MCGIVGIIDTAGGVSERLVAAMRDTMVHRGPDDGGVWASPDHRVVLGHRRLSILDLSPAGHQPMVRDSLCVTFNGEIYNHQDVRRDLEQRGHRFSSRSDTEVLLAAYQEWGHDCLDHLSGMFAFAIYDAARRTVFLARDRAGEKPLFYSIVGKRFSFASELKALMADPALPRRIDVTALSCYLAYGYVAGDMCILRNCHKLPAGHAMEVDVETATHRIWRYWDLPTESRRDIGVEDAIAELDTLLTRSVRRQLQADVPVAVLLSGGVDSSLVTALTARETGRVRTFTISFPGQGDFDESKYAKMVANHFGTDHTEIPADPMALDSLGDIVAQVDEPMSDYSLIPTLMVSRHVRQHATVALGGDGGDELFGGYRHYNWLQKLRRHHDRIPLAVRQAAAYAARRSPMGTRARTYMVGLNGSIDRMLSHVDLYFDEYSRDRVLNPNLHDLVKIQPEDFKQTLTGTGSLLRKATHLDFSSFMTDDVLCKVDRASMLASLEVRAPFLDHDVINFAFGLPDHLRATLDQRKIVPRILAERMLPAELDLTRKQGFTVPINNWVNASPGHEMFRDVLLNADPGIFNVGTMHTLLDLQRRGYSNGKRIFTLAMFEMWRRHYGASI